MKKTLFIVSAMMLCVLVSCTTNITNTKEEKKSSLYRILVADKYGFIDEHGKIVIEPQFDDAYKLFSEGVCFARIGERRGLIDNTGTFIMEFGDSVRSVADFNNGLSRIDCGDWLINKIGIIDKEGKLVIPANQYDVRIITDSNNDYLVVEGTNDNKDWFITDITGDTIGGTYDEILSGFVNGLCAVKLNGKWGYIGKTGKLTIDTIYDFARVFTDEGLARVSKGNEHFFIDKMGNRVFSVDSTITGFACNRAAVVLNGDKCFIDAHGKRVFSIDADEIFAFRKDDNMATIVKDGKASKIDTMGNVVLSTRYEYIGPFIGNIAPVEKDEKWGFIDSIGNEIISVTNDKYDNAFHNKNSKLRAVWNNINDIWCMSYYDLKGNLIWKDVSSGKKKLPRKPERKDFVEYFDDRMAELDQIEGIYYVTNKDYYQNRENPSNIGLNGTHSEFYAIVKDDRIDGFRAYCVDGSNKHWVNKFVRIGETNDYAILKIDKDNDYSSEGRVTLEEPSQFEFRLEQGHNVWNNFFVTYEFIRDYPPISEYEKIQKAEWSGTGFAIADGYVVTNYHVTKGAKSIRIKGINGDMSESYKSFVVASDKEHDISIIKVVDKDFEGFGTIPYNIGKVTVDVGDDVFVLGYPMTATMGEEIKLTDGKISAASGYKGDESMYQISAPVQPGNSGGPLFNSDGTVIGIVCAKHADAENANYAIKVSYLYSLVNGSDLGIKMPDNNKLKTKTLSKIVKQVEPFVYLIECSSR